MSASTTQPDGPLPEWALGQAMHGRDDADTLGRDERAQQLVRELEDERHDADDDPDEGGES